MKEKFSFIFTIKEMGGIVTWNLKTPKNVTWVTMEMPWTFTIQNKQNEYHTNETNIIIII